MKTNDTRHEGRIHKGHVTAISWVQAELWPGQMQLFNYVCPALLATF